MDQANNRGAGATPTATNTGGAVPEVWTLVPVQMTDAMRDAGNEIILDRCKLVRAYKAMLAAAPAISHSGEGNG